MWTSLLDYHIYVYQTIVLFALFSFLGWVIETIYRSVTNGRFVNAGFLRGPFTPIYGMGGIVIILAGILVRERSLPLQMIYFAALTTLLELVTGLVIEKLFGHKLWDYRDNRFNLKGIICLKYSVIWAVFAWIFFYIIFPLSYIAVSRMDPFVIKTAALAFSAYFILDFIFSALLMADFFHRLESIYLGLSNLRHEEMQKTAEKFSRIIRAFPHLNNVIENVLDRRFRSRFESMLASIAKKRHAKKARLEKEYESIVREIIRHPEYGKLKQYYHHNSSIYDHLQSVAYLSYRISKALGLDYVSTVRGALLHDFFLYDWRKHDLPDLAADKYHGFAHPKIALVNAKKHFPVNKMEEDIIVKHMWPITIVPPRYMESYVVTFADKYLSSKEYTVRFRKTVAEKKAKLKETKRKPKSFSGKK